MRMITKGILFLSVAAFLAGLSVPSEAQYNRMRRIPRNATFEDSLAGNHLKVDRISANDSTDIDIEDTLQVTTLVVTIDSTVTLAADTIKPYTSGATGVVVQNGFNLEVVDNVSSFATESQRAAGFVDGNILGRWRTKGKKDATIDYQAANINVKAAGTWGTGDAPTETTIEVTQDGASTVTEMLALNEVGQIVVAAGIELINTDASSFTWAIGFASFEGATIDFAAGQCYPSALNGTMISGFPVPSSLYGGTVVLDQITIHYSTVGAADDFDVDINITDRDGTITSIYSADSIGAGTTGVQNQTCLAADHTMLGRGIAIQIVETGVDAAADVVISDVAIAGHLE